MNSKDVHMGEPTLKQMNREIEANKKAIHGLKIQLGRQKGKKDAGTKGGQ